MRADVKLGMITALIAILVGGGYFLTRDRNDEVIPLGASAPGADAKPAPKADEPKSADSRAGRARPEAAGNKYRNPQGNRTKTPAKRAGRLPGDSPTKKDDLTRSAGLKDRDTQPSRIQPKAGQGDRHGASNPGKALPGSDIERPKTNTDSEKPKVNTPKPAIKPKPNSKTELPPRKPAAKPTNKVASNDRHKVQPGDTLATLAADYYGSEKFVGLLMTANPLIKDPKDLRVGMIVEIPPKPADGKVPPIPAGSGIPTPSEPSAKPKTTVAGTYTVKEGDTFYGIARDQLGDSNRWDELLELNKELVKGDPKNLRPGQVIKLPKK